MGAVFEEGVSNLFPELLLSLFGHTGGAFVQNDGDSSSKFPRLSVVIDWVSEAER